MAHQVNFTLRLVIPIYIEQGPALPCDQKTVASECMAGFVLDGAQLSQQ